MIKLVELECPNCGGKVKRVDEEMARCPHCETEFLIDKDEPEQIVHVHQAQPSSLVPAVLLVFFVLLLLIFLIIVASFSGEKTESGTPVSAVKEETFRSSFFKEFVVRVYGTNFEDVTAEQMEKLTYLKMYTQDGFDWAEYRLEDGPVTQLQFSTDLATDYMDLKNFPNLKGIYMEYGSLPETILGEFAQLEELECDNSPEQLALNLTTPEKLRKLICHGNSTMNGINSFVNLEYLEADCYHINDIKAVASLKNLKTLIIESGDEITDFGALHSLTGLEVLYLDSEKLKEISFVKNMKNLRELTLINTIVIDLSPLSDKADITYLKLEDNYEVKDYSVLSTLKGLEILHLDLCSDGEMPDVSQWSSLTELSINGADSLQFLAQLPTLKKLDLSAGVNRDLEVLANLTELNELTIGKIFGEVQGLDVLASLMNLKKLDISSMTVYGNVEGIFAIPGLEELDISDCSFGLDFERMPENTSLKRLYMNRVSLWENIQVYQDGIVTYLDYDELAMADHIGFVSNFPNLKQLYVQGNKLTDLTFTENLPQLTHLDITNNYITDLRPLQKLQRLETVWCGENSISQGNDLGEDVNVVLDSVAEEGAWWK